jgi:hypothetical protein
MQSYDVFDAALKTPQPYESLREVVKGRLGEGADREDLRVELEEFPKSGDSDARPMTIQSWRSSTT